MIRPTLADKNQPIVPLILRGKKRSLVHKQVGLQSSISPDIRINLDNNLNQIFDVLRQKKALSSINKESGLNKKKQVPKLNQRLVKQYINLVYKEYSIRDPLAEYTNSQSNKDGSNTQRRRNSRSFNHNSTNRKAVHLKESFLIEMFSPDQNSTHSPNQYRQTSSIKQARSTQISSPMKFNEKNKDMNQIRESYRYCFICQQPILQTNIESHQKNRCPQFSSLYSMSLRELKELLIKKIENIRHKIHKKLQINDVQNAQTALSSLFQQTYNYLRTIDINVIGLEHHLNFQTAKGHNNLAQKGEVKNRFDTVMQTFEIDYFILYGEIRKLQWFVSMYFNLENQYGANLKQNIQRSSLDRKHLRPKDPDRRFTLNE